MEPGPSTAPAGPSIASLLRPGVVDQQTIAELLVRVRDLLASAKCERAADALADEIEQLGYVPKKYDINGEARSQTLEQFMGSVNGSGINLVDVLTRLNELAVTGVPPVVRDLPIRLFASGRQAITRTTASAVMRKEPSRMVTQTLPVNLFQGAHNINVFAARELGARVPNRFLLPKESMQKLKLHSRVYGHLAPVFCMSFDRTGRYIITGADDSLIKVWDAHTGMLRFTFRGYSAEVADVAISHDNTVLGSGSVDSYLRAWCLQSGHPVLVSKSHTQAIAIVQFLPFVSGDVRYFVSCGCDANVVFHRYSAKTLEFVQPPTKFNERSAAGVKATSMCHSPGGNIVVVGDSQKYLHLYKVTEDNAFRLYELPAHADLIDSLAWSHNAMRFASGSKDGTAKVWFLDSEGPWKSVELSLPNASGGNDAQGANGNPTATNCTRCTTAAARARNNSYRVLMLGWSRQDDLLITTGSDNIVRTWKWRSGVILHQMKGHTDHPFQIVTHPVFTELIITTGHDGLLMVWDINTGENVGKHVNEKDNHDAVSIFDAKVSPDGTKVACVDQDGHLSILGIEDKPVADVPRQQFLKRDYCPVIYDAAGHVLDEHLETTPELLYPQRLVDAEAAEYDEDIQRRLPGFDMLPITLENGETRKPDEQVPWLKRPIVAPLSSSTLERSVKDMQLNTVAELEKFQGAGEGRGVIDVTNDAGERRLEPLPRRAQTTRRPTAPRRTAASIQAELHHLLNPTPGVPRYVLDSSFVSDSDDSDYSAGDESEQSEVQAQSSPSSHANLDVSDLFDDERDADYEERQNERRPSRRQRPAATKRRRVRRERVASASSAASEQSEEQPRPSATRRRRPPAGQGNRRRAVIEDSEESDSPPSEDATPAAPTTQRGTRPNRSPGEPGTSAAPKTTKKKKPVKEEKGGSPKHPGPLQINRFPDWMQEIRSRRFPYIAQVGDVVVYLTQGHRLYLAAVKKKKLYTPWRSMNPSPELDAEETCVVIETDYVLNPYRLCCLKLAQMKNGRKTGKVFDVYYHDYEDQPDFFVLKQHFDKSIGYKFTAGAKVECIMDNRFYTGTVQQHLVYEDAFPHSNWASLETFWDNGEPDRLSPWELQPKANGRVSETIATEEDIEHLGEYKPVEGDWPRQDEGQSLLDARECYLNRARAAICELLTVKEISETFGQPVDLGMFDDYAKLIAYPIDLGTIQQRIDHRFYRRSIALLQDIQFLAINATHYNLEESEEYNCSIALVEALFKFLSDSSLESAKSLYEELLPQAESLQEWEKPIVVDKEFSITEANAASESSDTPKWVRDLRAIIDEIKPSDEVLDTEEVKTVCEQMGQTIPQMIENMGTYDGPKAFFDALKSLIGAIKQNIDDHRSDAFKQLNEFSRKLDTKIKPIVGIYNRMKDDEKKKQERKEQKDLEAAMAESRAMYLNGSSQRQLRQRVRPETAKPYNTRRSSSGRYCDPDEEPDMPCSSNQLRERQEPSTSRPKSSIALAVASPPPTSSSASAQGRKNSGGRGPSSAEKQEEEHASGSAVAEQPQLASAAPPQRAVKREADEEDEETPDDSGDSDFVADNNSPAESEGKF